MKNVLFLDGAYEEFVDWAEKERDIFDRINRLIKDISRSPFKGLGKPEPLKHRYKGYWSRRITDEHRLVYKIEDDIINIVSMKGHYV
jgi:toxin YoeB